MKLLSLEITPTAVFYNVFSQVALPESRALCPKNYIISAAGGCSAPLPLSPPRLVRLWVDRAKKTIEWLSTKSINERSSKCDTNCSKSVTTQICSMFWETSLYISCSRCIRICVLPTDDWLWRSIKCQSVVIESEIGPKGRSAYLRHKRNTCLVYTRPFCLFQRFDWQSFPVLTKYVSDFDLFSAIQTICFYCLLGTCLFVFVLRVRWTLRPLKPTQRKFI